MINLSKEDAKSIRQLNKQKRRPENIGLISAGNGKSALPEYYVLSFCDRNITKSVNQLKNMQKNDNNWFKTKVDIEKTLRTGFENLNRDIVALSVLVDSFKCLKGREEDILTILRELEKQLNFRKKSLQEYYKCKEEFENIIGR